MGEQYFRGRRSEFHVQWVEFEMPKGCLSGFVIKTGLSGTNIMCIQLTTGPDKQPVLTVLGVFNNSEW